MLDLGNVYETAEVFINNISAGVKICKPYRFDLAPLLKEGANQIVVEVTNTLGCLLYTSPVIFGVEQQVMVMIGLFVNGVDKKA